MATYEPGLTRKGKNWLPLHRNENLFIEEKWLNEIIKKALLDADIRCYPDMNYFELRCALAKLHQADPDNIYVGNGADGVLADLLGCLRHTYDEMVFLDVGFPVYSILANRFRYKKQEINRKNIDNSQEGQLIVVDSPNSITGEAFSYDVFETILKKKNSFLIWDNTYGDFAGDKIIYPSLYNNEKKLVVVKSFSKYYGLAGLRLGYCIADKDLIKNLQIFKDVYNVNCMVQQMALELLKNKEQLEIYKNQMLQCKEKLIHLLKELGFTLTDSKANFVFIQHPKFSSEWLEKKLLEKCILTRRFNNPKIENYLRVAIPSEDKLAFFENSLKDSLKSF